MEKNSMAAHVVNVWLLLMMTFMADFSDLHHIIIHSSLKDVNS